MAFIIKTKRGYVGRHKLEDGGFWQRPFGMVSAGEPDTFWTRTEDKEFAHRFETPEEAAEVSVLLNAGDVYDEVSMFPVVWKPFVSNMLED